MNAEVLQRTGGYPRPAPKGGVLLDASMLAGKL